MADYRQDAVCPKCGWEYTYFSNTGCPNCARNEKKMKKEAFVDQAMTLARNVSPEEAIKMLAESLADEIYGY